MRLNSKTIYLATATTMLLMGAFMGGALSDYGTTFGFFHKHYRIELTAEQTPRNIWFCSKMGVAYGADLSPWDRATGRQEHCTIEAQADVLPDGSVDIYPGATTWYSRLFVNLPPARFSADQIKAIRLEYP